MRIRRFLTLCVCVLAVAGSSEYLRTLPALRSSLAPARVFGQEMPEGRLMRFPDIYKDKIVFSYAGDLWLVSRREAWRGASPRIRVWSFFPNSRPTASRSLSRGNTTAISMST